MVYVICYTLHNYRMKEVVISDEVTDICLEIVNFIDLAIIRYNVKRDLLFTFDFDKSNKEIKLQRLKDCGLFNFIIM